MTPPPTVILLESNDTVRKHVESVLSSAGWTVVCEQVSKDALNTLTRSKRNTSIALFISNFKLPKMDGDDILQQVKAISPLTQRMLLIPGDKPDILISAINKAEIHACIISPFQDQDLIDQAKQCFRQFRQALKRQQLKRVTTHQTRQMVEIAQKLKKKNERYNHLIDEKKAETIRLTALKRKQEHQNADLSNICLSSLMEHKKIPPSPDAYRQAFITLCNTLKTQFDQVTTRHHAVPARLDLKKMLSHDQKDSDPLLHKDRPASPELIEKIITAAFVRSMTAAGKSISPPPDADEPVTDQTDNLADTCFDLSLSINETRAYLKKTTAFEKNRPQFTLSDLLDLLREKKISYGRLDDEAIETWISQSFDEKLLIATGEEAIPGRDGEITVYFETQVTHPGEINADGSIDFTKRGDTPYVKKGDLLAQKTASQDGTPGISVFNTPIPVEQVIDPVFMAGPGTQLSEDGFHLHATTDGQPHWDTLGTFSVNPELLIPGDVDFTTGNIDFNGNVVVKGIIKAGFTVRAINLTAQAIEGGIIYLSGDLNVSAGITASNISTHGNIYAKFINHSRVMGLGNLTISKEIIDSDILLSGICQNTTGHIISSQIKAKQGIEAGKIGTSYSTPVKLKAGGEDHVETRIKQIDQALEASVTKFNEFLSNIKALEDQDHAIYRQINENARIQNQTKVEITALKKSLPEQETSKGLLRYQEISVKIKNRIKTARAAEQELNRIFETQDKIAADLQRLRDHITRLEERENALRIEKTALKVFSKTAKSLSMITVAKTIKQDSMISGPNASIIIKEDRRGCKIQEIAAQEDGIPYYEMTISDL
ncbi:flagellar assembly protein A [Desulfobacula sp.]|uniref:flagellar assembly protein A n=1 Tax=Desulfobacula sp. TaxID=2593537 RepID=UPI0026141260|nr:flagellar assembly protein A [Desulfobacula sp.]